MYQRIETERLILRVLDKTYVSQVLAFLEENRQDFSRYEAEKKEIYFTKYYQEYVIQNEYEASLKKIYLRYYLSEKGSEERIIGTVSVGQLRAFPYCSGVLGYKMAVAKKNQGYATEAVQAVCRSAAEYLGLHRLEAYTLEDNLPSIRVLEKCGFRREGICRQNLNINGQWHDHCLYGRILEDSADSQ